VIKSLLKLAASVSLIGAIFISPVALNPIANFTAEAATEEEVFEKLGGVPVFTITDDKGTPILGSVNQDAGAGDRQLLLFFLNPDDATALINQIKTTNPQVGNKAQVIVRSMNDAYQVIQDNKDEAIAFQIVPSQTSLEAARKILTAQGKPADQLPNVPVFFATGGDSGNDSGLLTLEQDGQQIVPFFFEQKDLEGLISRARQQQADVANNTKIQVTSLFQVLDSMISDNDAATRDTERFTFVPSREAFEYVIENADNAQ
jgi:hypothetical protein